MLRGTTRYLDDRNPQGLLHVHFVRSLVAHAEITDIDVDGARDHPGVVEVVTAADLGLNPLRGFFLVPEVFNRPPLASDVVRFVGEPVVAVVAETREAAVDAAEAVIVDYRDLPVVTEPRAALSDDAPVLFPGASSNLVLEYRTDADPERLSGHDVVVRGEFVNQRVAGGPMEPSVALAEPDGDGVVVWCTTQGPFGVQGAVASVLGIDSGAVRVRTEAVGGGFGPKAVPYPEFAVVAALALRTGRPVRWTETRTENLVNMAHGRDQHQTYEMGFTTDGRICWLRGQVLANAGAYPVIGGFLPSLTMLMASGPYRIPVVDFTARSAATNTTPTAAFRGAGRPEATAALERLLDIAAGELGLDPAEIRRRNLLASSEFPLTTPTGAEMDSGDYQRALDEVLDLSDYHRLREEQEARRRAGDARVLGIGLSIYVEVTAGDLYEEYGSVTVEPDGRILMRVGTHSQGQGHETAYGQIVASVLGVEPEQVTLLQGDTAEAPHGMGTVASRSMQTSGSALHESAQAVLTKARELAAHLLEASVDDMILTGAGIGVAGVPAAALTWGELALAAQGDDLPAGMSPNLAAATDFDQGEATYPFGAHVAVVEVDTHTGAVELLRHCAVDDCGTLINPLLARGQVQGGIAQGAAQALFEEIRYDDEGTPLTATFLDYQIPGPPELPAFETRQIETPTPRNPLGVKGIGESGTIGSLPAVHNAVIDALSHLGVRHIDMPLHPQRVWRAIQRSSIRSGVGAVDAASSPPAPATSGRDGRRCGGGRDAPRW